uniref:ZmAO-1 n=1 Tax=Arundo donax TaxID=35708 RepID=A0A0A9BAK3_ARUDO
MPSEPHSGINMLSSRVLESHGGCCRNSSKVRHSLSEATWMVTDEPAARSTVAISDTNCSLCAMIMFPPIVAVF